MAPRPTIPVDYEFVAGKHFFTAAAALGRGLCVAHGDLRAAFEEVGRQLGVILAENHGLTLSGDEGLGGLEELRASVSAAPGEGERIAPRRFEVDWRAWTLVPPSF